MTKIVALHVGPVAAGSAGGADEGMGFFGWIARLFWVGVVLVAGVAAGARAITAAAPAAQAAGGGSVPVGNPLVGTLLGVFGLGLLAVGGLWMLFGLIYQNFLPAGAVMACGAFAASGLVPAGKFPPALTDKLKPAGLALAGAAAVLALLHLVVGGWPLF